MVSIKQIYLQKIVKVNSTEFCEFRFCEFQVNLWEGTDIIAAQEWNSMDFSLGVIPFQFDPPHSGEDQTMQNVTFWPQNTYLEIRNSPSYAYYAGTKYTNYAGKRKYQLLKDAVWQLKFHCLQTLFKAGACNFTWSWRI